jgi:hypothetical protein
MDPRRLAQIRGKPNYFSGELSSTRSFQRSSVLVITAKYWICA